MTAMRIAQRTDHGVPEGTYRCSNFFLDTLTDADVKPSDARASSDQRAMNSRAAWMINCVLSRDAPYDPARPDISVVFEHFRKIFQAAAKRPLPSATRTKHY